MATAKKAGSNPVAELSKVDKSRKKSGGRKPGTPNKKTAEVQKAVEESGITPLDYMLKIMRDDSIPEDAELAQIIALAGLRFEAAKAAAPYVHAKLSSIEVNANVTTHEASLDDLA